MAESSNPRVPVASESGGNQSTFISLERPKKDKKARRVLHFSDGVLEEYSTDEEEENTPLQPPVDPRTLTWVPWVWFYCWTAAHKVWTAADFCGEKLAWFFGITTPKYQSAIDEYHRKKEEEEKEKAEEERKQNEAHGLSASDVKLVEDKTMIGENLDKY